MATKPTANPAGVVTSSPVGPSVSPGKQSQTRSLQRAISATSGRRSLSNLPALVREYEMGAPEQLLSDRQARRRELDVAELEYGSVGEFRPKQFEETRPVFSSRNVTKAMPLLLVMSTLGGKRTKGNALGMMKAMTAGMKGLQEGNDKGYKQALFDYESNFKEFQQREEVRRQQYDILKNAAKDGLQLARTRYSDSLKAVDDWESKLLDDMKTAITLAKTNQDFIKTNLEIKKLQSASEQPKGKKRDFLTAETVNKTMGFVTLLNDVNAALDVMDKRPQDFTTAINAAYVWSPKGTELFSAVGGPFKNQSSAVRQALPSQQTWRRALNTQVVQNAGLSQTVAEMTSQLAAFGSQTLEARKSGMARVRLSLLRDLKAKAALSDAFRDALEEGIGMPIDVALENAKLDLARVESQIRGEDTGIPANARAAGVTQAEWNEMTEEERALWR